MGQFLYSNKNKQIININNYYTFDEIIDSCKEFNNYLHIDEELSYPEILVDERIKKYPLISYNNRKKFYTKGITPQIIDSSNRYLYYFSLPLLQNEHIISEINVVNSNCEIFLSYKFLEDEILIKNEKDLFARVDVFYNDFSIVLVCENDQVPEFFEIISKRFLINIQYLKERNIPLVYDIKHPYDKHLEKLKKISILGSPYRYKDYFMGIGGAVQKQLVDGEMTKSFNELCT